MTRQQNRIAAQKFLYPAAQKQVVAGVQLCGACLADGLFEFMRMAARIFLLWIFLSFPGRKKARLCFDFIVSQISRSNTLFCSFWAATKAPVRPGLGMVWFFDNLLPLWGAAGCAFLACCVFLT